MSTTKPSEVESVATNATMQSVLNTENRHTYAMIRGTNLGFFPILDRLIIEEDTFRTGYECKQCDGIGEILCTECAGTKKLAKRIFDSETGQFFVDHNSSQALECTNCDISGYIICPNCNGKGASIVIPEMSMRRPTTGIVRAIGDAVKLFAIGDHVMYGNHAGHLLDFRKKKVVIKILREDEILCLISGVMKAVE